MKKLFILIMVLYSSGVFSQGIGARRYLAQDTTTLTGGKVIVDTAKALVFTSGTVTHGLYSDTVTIASSQWTTSGSDIYYNTGKVQIGSTTIGGQALNLNGATNVYAAFYIANVLKDLVGASSGAGNGITGSSAGDLILRSSTNTLISGDGGTTAGISVTSTGFVGMGDRIGTFALDVYKSAATAKMGVQSGLNTGQAFTQALNNSGNGFQAGSTGSTFVTSGLTAANNTFVQSNGSAAMVLKTEGGVAAPMIFGINIGGVAAVEAGRFNTTGKLWLNQTANIATGQFEVTQAGGNPQITTAYDATHYTTLNTNSSGNLTIAPNGGTATVSGNLTVGLAKSLTITEGTDGRSGQVALVAGTKAITITGITTSSRAFVQFVAQGGTSTGIFQYKAVCTSNTLTITAVDWSGTIVNTDTSTLNYFVIN